MNVLVIGSRNSGTKNNPLDIYESLQADENVDVSMAFWEDVTVVVNDRNVGAYTSEGDLLSLKPDLVVMFGWYKSGKQSIYRDFAFSVGLYLNANGVAIWNSEVMHQRSTSKLSCMVQLALAGIPVPDTKFSLSGGHIDSMELPFVAKAASASRGESNFLIESEDDRREIENSKMYLLAQPFLQNDHDLRIICMNGTPRLVLKRSRKAGSDTHLNNTSKGGSAEWIDVDQLDEDLLTKCAEICRIMNREMAGIDMMPDNSSEIGYSCLEVNAIPQLTSGIDPNIKLAALRQAIGEITK